MALISSSIATTVYLFLIQLNILALFYAFSQEKFFGLSNKYLILILGFLTWYINYNYMVKPRKFLRLNFKKGKNGGLIIIMQIIILLGAFIFLANINRSKVGI